MKERLLLLLKEMNLTAGRFAEILDVQPSSISHLLSGRNKPNFDFLTKLIDRFPDVNSDWFITGKGEMLRKQSSYENKNEQEIASEIKINPPGEIGTKTETNVFEKRVSLSSFVPPLSSEKKSEYDTPALFVAVEREVEDGLPSTPPSPTERKAEYGSPTLSTPVEEKAERDFLLHSAQPASTEKKMNPPALSDEGKRVEKIVFFYSDRTFSVYTEEK